VHVDEARRDGEAGGVNGPPRRLPHEIADGGDGVAGNPQISARASRAGPVNDLTANDLQVKHDAPNNIRRDNAPSTPIRSIGC
jgi:hypothetical protein